MDQVLQIDLAACVSSRHGIKVRWRENRMVKLACRVSAAYLVAAFALSAQASAGKWNDVKALLPGTEIRLVSGQSTARGPIQSVTDDSVVLTTAKGQET